MDYVRLGATGLEVSRLCLGCMTYGNPAWRPWTLGEEDARLHFKKAFDLGINFFDIADMYSDGVSEEVTGKLLREMASRDDYVLATKVFFPVAEGGDLKLCKGQTVIQVLSEKICFNQFFKIGISSRDDSHINFDCFCPPDPLKFLVFNDAKNLVL